MSNQSLALITSQPILDLLNNLDSEGSRNIYKHDLAYFDGWMLEQGISLEAVTESDIINYRAYLRDNYSKATAQRMFVVCRQLFKKLAGKVRPDDPAAKVKGFSLDNESTHIALSEQQTIDLIESIDTSTQKGKRDYAIISLLVRTGIRRAECAALNIGDLHEEQGHHIAFIQHGKGDKRLKVKIPVDVFRALADYISETGREIGSLDDPLFIGFDRRPQHAGKRISAKVIERIVAEYGERIGLKAPDLLTPHDLRSTFITLSREGGASLQQVQYAVGHRNPMTTERYDKRKFNLDNNAVDYIKLWK